MAEERPEMSGEDLYDAATTPEAAPAETPEAPEEAAPEEAPGRARDDLGRFVRAEQTVGAESEPEPEPERKEEYHRIPLAELLNEREKRQREQLRAENALRELEQLRQQLQAPKAPPPDQFQHPDEYNAYWQNELEALRYEQAWALRNMKAEFSMQTAHREHKEVFENAYQAVMERAAEGDRTVAQMVANAPDPGQAMVNWYKHEQTMRVVGDDPQAYAAKVLEEALNNPEFLAKALEKAKGVASARPTQIQLPPSLNKATSSGKPTDTSIMSDAQLYQHSIGR